MMEESVRDVIALLLEEGDILVLQGCGGVRGLYETRFAGGKF